MIYHTFSYSREIVCKLVMKAVILGASRVDVVWDSELGAFLTFN